MYICVCNCLKEEHCRNALKQGATTPLDIYEKQGCKPKCGRCVPFVEETFFKSTQASADERL